MRRVAASAGVALAVVAFTGPALSAQPWQAGAPGADLGSFVLFGGALQPNTTFDDGSSFDSGAGFGASVTYWGVTHFGLRSGFFRASTQGRADTELSPIGGQNPTVWVYSLDVMTRYPRVNDNIAWFPYLAIGFGGKSFRWNPDWPNPPGVTSSAWTGAAGVEIRRAASGWVGLFAEVRSYLYDFEALQYAHNAQRSNDLLFTAGITLNR